MSCNSIKKNTNKVCTGDLDKRIQIQTSSIAGTSSRGVSTTTTFTTIATVWAMSKTTPTTEFIDGVNVVNGLNTDWFIRYTSTIDFEQQLWILWNNNLFKVVNVDNIDKDDLFMRIRTRETGDKDILVNKR